MINTEDIKKNSLGIGVLKKDGGIFFDDYAFRTGDEEDIKLLDELVAMFEDGQLHSASLIKVQNSFDFKTPLSVVFASYKPERDFVKRMVRDENARAVGSWIKSLDVGFYSVEYSWRKGEHPKQGSFNPDFFIKLGMIF